MKIKIFVIVILTLFVISGFGFAWPSDGNTHEVVAAEPIGGGMLGGYVGEIKTIEGSGGYPSLAPKVGKIKEPIKGSGSVEIEGSISGYPIGTSTYMEDDIIGWLGGDELKTPKEIKGSSYPT